MLSLPLRTKDEAVNASASALTIPMNQLDVTGRNDSNVAANGEVISRELNIPVCMSVTRITTKGDVPHEERYILSPAEVDAIWTNPFESPGVYEGMSDAHLKAHSEETRKAIRALLTRFHEKASARVLRKLTNGDTEEGTDYEYTEDEYVMLEAPFKWNDSNVVDVREESKMIEDAEPASDEPADEWKECVEDYAMDDDVDMMG
jgi:hypothetical protein